MGRLTKNIISNFEIHNLPVTSESMTFIYVIAPETGNTVKIGYSEDPEARLKQLQTGHPQQLKLIHTEEVDDCVARAIEQKIHVANSSLRLKGEWFSMSVEQAKDEIIFARITYGEDPLLR